jgi:hypothetical protein
MQVQLRRGSRDILTAFGTLIFVLGLGAVFSAAIFSPELFWLARIGVWAMGSGISLIILIGLVRLLFRIVPGWRRTGGQCLEVDFRVGSEVHCGEKFKWQMSFMPRRSTVIKRWSVALVAVHEWQSKEELEGERILELTNALSPWVRYAKGIPFMLSGELFVPDQAPPSSKQQDDAVSWFLEIRLRLFWHSFIGTIPLNVVATAGETQRSSISSS